MVANQKEDNMKWILRPVILLAIIAAGACVFTSGARAATSYEVYGFAMMDAGYNSIGVDPEWFDVQRPTKLPEIKDEYGKDGSTFFSVRQTRFGVKTGTPTDRGELKTQFEFEMFGVGVDAGQTTIRLRHAYGELGKWGAGQTWSPFMDIDVFPNTVEYWGPPGMAFFRNVQIRYMPIQGDTRLTIALERPGASADGGIHSDILDAGNLNPRFPVPDLSAEYRRAISKGYVEVAGIVRRIQWEDLGATPSQDLSGNVTGWGLHASSNLKFAKDVLRLSALYGEGIENYMNDAPVDVGTEADPGNPSTPIKGVALPVTGFVAFLDHTWNPKASSSIGYSMIQIDNSSGQAPDAFKTGHYVLGNVMVYPVANVMAGVEVGWIRRENNSDNFTSDDYHVQVSAKYNFSFSGGGQ
jgi:hypothetical protein